MLLGCVYEAGFVLLFEVPATNSADREQAGGGSCGTRDAGLDLPNASQWGALPADRNRGGHRVQTAQKHSASRESTDPAWCSIEGYSLPGVVFRNNQLN